MGKLEASTEREFCRTGVKPILINMTSRSPDSGGCEGRRPESADIAATKWSRWERHPFGKSLRLQQASVAATFTVASRGSSSRKRRGREYQDMCKIILAWVEAPFHRKNEGSANVPQTEVCGYDGSDGVGATFSKGILRTGCVDRGLILKNKNWILKR